MQQQEGKAPAVGVSVTMNLGGDRQIVLQTFFEQEDSETAKNRLVDGLLKVGDRQKAKYEITDFEEGLIKHRTALANFEEDLARIEEDHKRKINSLNIEVIEMHSLRKDEYEAGYAEHMKAGRRTEYEPRGFRQTNLARIDSALETNKQGKHKLEAERDAAVGNLEISRKRYKEEIARIESEIEKRRILIAGAANEG